MGYEERKDFEVEKTGFSTVAEPHPSEIVKGGIINEEVSMQELKNAIPEYCFTPSLFWSFFYLFRDLTYTSILSYGLYKALHTPAILDSPALYYSVMMAYGFAQGVVWTGLWVIAHDCGHSGFSKYGMLNDAVGFTLHSFLLAPYFSWKSTHRRHHIYANHIEKDLNYVPPQRGEYSKQIRAAADTLEDVGQDAPLVLFLRIILQQVIGWNWYIISNITCPSSATVKKGMSVWRHSHFDPWGAMFRQTEAMSIILSDMGCLATIYTLYLLYPKFGSFETLFWAYIVPWSWVNHWIVMITYLHHTHPDLPKYSADSWSFIRGATATMDRNFGIIGTHFFHHISSDHVTHHLFSRIPHYYGPTVTKAIKPLLGRHYHGNGSFNWGDLKVAFSQCQWVEGDEGLDQKYGLIPKEAKVGEKGEVVSDADYKKDQALWYRSGVSPAPEFKMREAGLF